MPDLINIKEEPIKSLLPTLLEDKTTKKNIIWATDIYSDLGPGYSDKNQLTTELLLGRFTLQPRIAKSLEEQQQRTRTKAEVMTPVWICNRMNNYLDEQWFDRCDVFNHENEDHSWVATAGSIVFNANSWQSYVDSRRLEITCGEAPYLVSRYDTTTGELISPLSRRIGILDRKLRVVNENTETEEEWITWAERAIQSSYGYEYQGDSLLIARINILLTYWEYYLERWKKEPPKTILQHIGNIIAWNLWQMDGMKDTVPLGKPYEEYHQISMLDLFTEAEPADSEMSLPCQVHNWREKSSILFMECKRRGIVMGKKMFDFVIGNPPYMESTDSESTRMPPVYNIFMDSAYDISDHVELITPARFLFNGGYTPKTWNEKMLHDEHFKVLCYENDAEVIFPNTEIKGGVAITYRDANRDFGAIEIFTKYPELNQILKSVKAKQKNAFIGLDTVINSPLNFQLSELMKQEHPDLVDRLRTSAFTALEEVFFVDKPNDGHSYVAMLGLLNSKRVFRYIRQDYLRENGETLNKYTVLLPKACGNGDLGETLSSTVISEPGMAYTQTFIGIGTYNTRNEALNTDKYIKTKFARAMLGILKVTQDCPGPKWHYVPLQDFTDSSDICWDKPIHAIDIQLYRKYDLSPEEIAFIESHVKEME